MFNYEFFRRKMQNNSEEKITNTVFATWYGNTLATILLTVIFADILRIIMRYLPIKIYWITYFAILFIIGIYLGTRKSGLAISKSKIIYVQFKHLSFKEKKVFEIPLEKIRSLTVNKIFNFIIVKISFISNMGNLEKIKCMFNSFILGSSKEYKKNKEELYKFLKETEKIIDRGDF